MPSKKRIIDIGSGACPKSDATVLCDKYLDKNIHLWGKNTLIDERPFVLCDVECLPFRDSAFDYSYIISVLEHVPNPEKAVRELHRIADAGYIELPSIVTECIRYCPQHLTGGVFSRNHLRFVRKPLDPNSLLKLQSIPKGKDVIGLLCWAMNVRLDWKKVEGNVVYTRRHSLKRLLCLFRMFVRRKWVTINKKDA